MGIDGAIEALEYDMTSPSPNAVAAESAIKQIGKEINRLRSVRGERLEDIASYLDIKSTYLFSIEQGDLSSIPSKGDAKAMLRSYAGYLGLDEEALMGPLDMIITSLQGENAPPDPVKPGWIDRTSVTILASSMVLGVVVGWSWIGDVSQFDLIAPPVTADVADAAPTEPQEEGEGGEALTESAVSALPVGENAPADVELAGLPIEDLSEDEAEAADAILAELKATVMDDGETDALQVVETIEAAIAGSPAKTVPPKGEERPANVLAAAVAETGAGAHIYEAGNTDARVIVRALNDVSVQVTSLSRDYVWTRTMSAEEMLLVPHRDDLELWTSSAADIELLLDGSILPPLGPPDTVISGMSLAASSLEVLTDEQADGSAKPTF